MKPFVTLFPFLLLASLGLRSQPGSGQLTAILADRHSAAPLQGSTITLLHARDSSPVAVSFSDQRGRFLFTGLAGNSYLVVCTFLGYRPVSRQVLISPEKKVADLDTIFLERTGLNLAMIDITVKRPPVAMKGDTLEFDGDYYRPRENARMAELLKKLPGVTIEKDGTIKVNGESVKRILIDGRPFFADDPKMAAQNLSSDIVQKIQLFEKAPDGTVVVSGDEKEKIINITLKDNYRRGLVGQASAGYGTEDRFALNGNINRFRKSGQMAVILNGNNVNDFLVSGGQVGDMGIRRNWNGGINYFGELSKKTNLSASYTLNDTKIENNRNSRRLTVIGDSSLSYRQESASMNKQSDHSIYLIMDSKPDSMTIINLISNANFSAGNERLDNQYQTSRSSGQLLNRGITRNLGGSNGANYSVSGNVQRNFPGSGRLNADVILSTGRSNRTKYNRSLFDVFGDSATAYRQTVDQQMEISNNQNMLSFSLGYGQPFVLGSAVDISYEFSRSFTSADNRTFEFDTTKGAYTRLNDSLSNLLKSTLYQQRVGFKLIGKNKQLSYSLGFYLKLSSLKSHLSNKSIVENSLVEKKFIDFMPNISLSYSFTGNKRIELAYFTISNPPNSDQLQVVPDYSNPLFIKSGNPELNRNFIHSINLLYNYFGSSRPVRFYARANARYYQDMVISALWFDSAAVQHSQPVNVDGCFTYQVNMGSTVPLEGLHTTLESAVNASLNGNRSFINNQENQITNLRYQGSLNLNYNNANNTEVSLGASLTYNRASYDVSSAFNNSYLNYSLALSAGLALPAGFRIGGNLEYTKNSGNSAGYNLGAALLNASIEKSLIKDRKGLIKIQAFDLLRQNVSITRNVGIGFIEDAETRVLQRFFLVSFSWFFKPSGTGKPGP